MGQPSHLPNELIYRIIETACLMELHRTSRYHLHPRRRLAFASLVRGVCSSWRDIIDLSTDGHFWAAVLALNFGMGFTDTNLPQQLMTFHRHLAESRGCSLIVSFDFSVDDRFKATTQVYEIESSDISFDINLRLFLHGFQMILPYQRQLFEIAMMAGSQPQINHYAYELLCSIGNAPRLTKLSLGHVRWYNPTGLNEGFYRPSLQDIRELEATIPNFQHILRNNNAKRIESIFSIEHFRNLQSLEISRDGWLSEMALPPQISRLWINDSRVTSFDLRNLSAQPAICDSLTNLEIWNGEQNATVEKERIHFVQQHVSLPCLHSIQLGDFSANVIGYLTHMHLPRIESASIILNDQVVERPPTARLPQATGPLFTSLLHLSLSGEEPWLVLPLLSLLASSSLSYLDLRFWEGEEATQLGSDSYDQQFQDCLGIVQPKTLKIGSRDLKRLFFILKSLSQSDLTNLDLEWDLTEIKVPPRFTGNESDEIRSSIASSSLVKLKLAGMPLHLIHDILSFMKAHALEELTLEPPLDDKFPTSITSTSVSNYNQHSNAKVAQYAFLSKLCFSQIPLPITSAILRQFFDLVPNMAHVMLDIGSNWSMGRSNYLKGPSIHKTSARKFWIPVYEALQPDTGSGLCPLLRLTNLTISFPLECKLEDLEALEEPLSVLSHLFRARADSGARHLKLKIPAEWDYNYQHQPYTTLVRLTFG
jgi:hypothetical protein